MAIKINWKDLQKRIINWIEVEKVMCNWIQIRPDVVPPTPTGNYLRFTSTLDFSPRWIDTTVSLTKTGNPTTVYLEYSFDGTSWSDYTIWASIVVPYLSTIYFRNKSESVTGFSTSGSDYYKFYFVWQYECAWNVNYLLCKNSVDPTVRLPNYCYYYLFRDWTITTAPELPSQNIWERTYYGMFYDSNIRTAPALPLISVSSYWCQNMFRNCDSLTQLPDISNANSNDTWFQYMFTNCNNIKISETQTWEYTNAYTMPNFTLHGADGMFSGTWGTFTGNPTSSTTYYTSNTVI